MYDKLLKIIKYVLSDGNVGVSEKDRLSRLSIDELVGIYKLAKYHGIAAIVADGLSKINAHLIIDCIKEKEDNKKLYDRLYGSALLQAIYIDKNQAFELDRIRKLFNENDISFIPLKGAVLKKFYEKSYLRECCDIDILIKDENFDKAKDLLVEKLSYKSGERTTYDLPMTSPSGIEVELHHKLIYEAGMQKEMIKPLDAVWDTAISVNNNSEKLKAKSGEYRMSDEMFYYFHIVHMAKHFFTGGCGIKSFIDLYILNKKYNVDSKIDKILENGNLYNFTKSCSKLTKVWFEDETHDDITKLLEEYVFNGGAYGNMEQFSAIRNVRSGGGVKHILSRLLLPKKDMISRYPELKNKLYLMPIYQVKRWVSALTGENKKFFANELSSTIKIKQDDKEKIDRLLKKVGLL